MRKHPAVYAKALVAVLLAGLTAAQIGFQDGGWSNADSATVAIALVTALLVYLVPNKT